MLFLCGGVCTICLWFKITVDKKRADNSIFLLQKKRETKKKIIKFCERVEKKKFENVVWWRRIYYQFESRIDFIYHRITKSKAFLTNPEMCTVSKSRRHFMLERTQEIMPLAWMCLPRLSIGCWETAHYGRSGKSFTAKFYELNLNFNRFAHISRWHKWWWWWASSIAFDNDSHSQSMMCTLYIIVNIVTVKFYLHNTLFEHVNTNL